MGTNRVIRATFSDWRTVKSRKCLQIIFELPLEQQAEVLTMLGAPMPDKETWCAIALLDQAQSQPKGDARYRDAANAMPPLDADEKGTLKTSTLGSSFIQSEQGKARYRNAGDVGKALIRAAQLPKDPRFLAWVSQKWNFPASNEADAINYIRDVCCDGQSRKLIAEVQENYDRFVRMETEYLLSSGIIPEPR